MDGDGNVKVLGLVEATPSGVVPAGDAAPAVSDIIDAMLVMDPDLGRPLDPVSDADRWVRHLPLALRGAYLWADPVAPTSPGR
jgi:hypothetical protein